MNVEEFTQTFPVLTELVGDPYLRDMVASLLRTLEEDRTKLADGRRGYSRGFWNTVITMLAAPLASMRPMAMFRLQAIESGLRAAKMISKQRKFQPSLLTDDTGFLQVVAELLVVGRLHSQGSSFDIERLGAKPPRNYDLHLGLPSGVELHIDVKWRTPSPTGEERSGTLHNLEKLLHLSDLDSAAIVTLGQNFLTAENQIAIAESLEWLSKNEGSLPAATTVTDPYDPCITNVGGELHGRIWEHLVGGGIASLFTLPDGTLCASLDGTREFVFGSGFLRSVSLVEGRGIAVIPKSETRAIVPRSVLDEVDVAATPELDHTSTESQGIRNLLLSVYEQLPAAPYNIACLGLHSWHDLDDAEWAVLGFDIPHNTGYRRHGGLVDQPEFATVSGVLVFALAQDSCSAPPNVVARYIGNPKSASPVPPGIVRALKGALSASPAGIPC